MPNHVTTRARFNEIAKRWIPDDVADAMEEELFADAGLSSSDIDALRAECDRVPDTDHARERLGEAREALARVQAPSHPDQDKDRLYYPLLFLCETVAPVLDWLDGDDETVPALAIQASPNGETNG